MWATRTSGLIGMTMAVLYLGIITGQEEGFTFWSIFWLIIMSGAGLVAWFADRAGWVTGRRMAIGSMIIFIVLAILLPPVTFVFLGAAILSLLGFAGVPEPEESA